MSPPPSRRAQSPDRVEVQARADLAAGRWRKARDAFKELSKRDRDTFQPLLIEANVGLARSMLAKHLISEAQQVLAYVRTIAPTAIIAALELEITAQATDTPKGAPDAVALLGDGALSPDEQYRLADNLVAAFTRAEKGNGNTEQTRVSGELQAIHNAIEALCLGNHEQALDVVRPLKRDSVFAQWRVFVRAVAAYQRGDTGKALQYFAELPANSGAGRAGIAWRLALGQSAAAGVENRTEAVLEAAGTLVGAPGWGRTLARADALWHAGKHAASYRAVRDANVSFPSDGADLSGALSDFYFHSVFVLHDNGRDKYVDALLDIEIKRSGKNPVELKMIRRVLCLLFTSGRDNSFEPDDVRLMWETFLAGHERLHGPNPRLASVAWAWLGEVLARPQAPFIRRAPRRGDLNTAIAALQKSIALDPSNLAAHLALASVYHASKGTRERNQLLDTMAKRFPNDKQVLLAVGIACLDRKAAAKSLEYFEHALALDRLDPATPDLLVTACLRLALQYLQKKRVVDARRVLDRAAEFAVDSAENFVRSRWCLAARRGVLETLYGDATLGALSLDAARTTSPRAAALLFFVRSAWSHYSADRPFPPTLQAELKQATTERPNVADAIELAKIWRYWTNNGSTPRRASPEESLLQRYLKSAARTPFTRDEAAALVSLLLKVPGLAQETLAFTSKVLKRDPADPLFQLYRDLLGPFPMLNRMHYESILDEARRRGDVAAEQLAYEVAAQYGVFGAAGAPPWDDSDDEPGMLDDDDDSDDAPMIPPGLNASPDIEAVIAAIMERMARTQAAGQKKRKPQIAAPQTPKQQPAKPKPVIVPDPAQPDLF